MMNGRFTERKILDVLDWLYEKAINGFAGLDSSQQFAEEYSRGDAPLRDKINSLIRWQNAKCITSGFLTGLCGIVTLPVGISAYITASLFVQVRMVAAIASMCGLDVNDDRVKTMVYVCLAGNAAGEIFQRFSINLSSRLFSGNLSGQVIARINRAVGFSLLTRFGETGLVNLAELLPFIGGIAGGTIGGLTSNLIGKVARDTFYPFAEEGAQLVVVEKSNPLRLPGNRPALARVF